MEADEVVGVLNDVMDATVHYRQEPRGSANRGIHTVGGRQDPRWVYQDATAGMLVAFAIESQAAHIGESPCRCSVEALKQHPNQNEILLLKNGSFTYSSA